MTFYSDLLTLIDSRAESEYTGSVAECGHLQPYLLGLRKLLEIRANLIRGGSTLSFYTDLLTDIETRIETSYEGLLSELGDNAPNALSLPALLQLRDYLNASEGGGGGGGSGKLLQTQYAQFDVGIFEPYTADTQTPIPDFELAITPSSASSKILITINANAGLTDLTNGSGAINYILGLTRNGTPINNVTDQLGFFSGLATDPMAEAPQSFAQFLDSPNTTSPVTYRITVANRSEPAPSADLYLYAHQFDVIRKSSILLQEITYP